MVVALLASGTLVGMSAQASGDMTYVPSSQYATPGVSVLFIECPSGTKVTGGGFFVSGGVQVTRSEPLWVSAPPYKWRIDFYNPGSVDQFIGGHAICKEN